MIEDIARKIAKFQEKKPFTIILIFALISILLIPGIFNLINNVEPSLEKVLPQEIDEIKTMNLMRSNFGADMIYLVVYTKGPVNDVRNPDFVKYIDLLDSRISFEKNIVEVISISDQIKLVNNDIIPNSLEEIKLMMDVYPSPYDLTNEDYSFSVIQIRSDTGSDAKEIAELISAINEDITSLEEHNPGSSIQITGFSAIDKATFEVIMSDFAFITLISMILVGIVVFITFKSLVRGMLPMVVVMTSLLWTMGIVGYFGLTITVVSMVAAAMIMGLGIDFGIHIVHSFFELRKTKSRNKSLEETLSELLRAMIGASSTTMAGFLALLFGVLPAMKTLAIILALGIFNTLLGAVFLLPTLVYLYDFTLIKKKKS